MILQDKPPARINHLVTLTSSFSIVLRLVFAWSLPGIAQRAFVPLHAEQRQRVTPRACPISLVAPGFSALRSNCPNRVSIPCTPARLHALHARRQTPDARQLTRQAVPQAKRQVRQLTRQAVPQAKRQVRQLTRQAVPQVNACKPVHMLVHTRSGWGYPNGVRTRLARLLNALVRTVSRFQPQPFNGVSQAFQGASVFALRQCLETALKHRFHGFTSPGGHAMGQEWNGVSRFHRRNQHSFFFQAKNQTPVLCGVETDIVFLFSAYRKTQVKRAQQTHVWKFVTRSRYGLLGIVPAGSVPNEWVVSGARTSNTRPSNFTEHMMTRSYKLLQAEREGCI